MTTWVQEWFLARSRRLIRELGVTLRKTFIYIYNIYVQSFCVHVQLELESLHLWSWMHDHEGLQLLRLNIKARYRLQLAPMAKCTCLTWLLDDQLDLRTRLNFFEKSQLINRPNTSHRGLNDKKKCCSLGQIRSQTTVKSRVGGPNWECQWILSQAQYIQV